MAKYPTRRQLLSEDYQNQVRHDAAIANALSQLVGRMEAQEAEMEAEREEHRRQIEEMRKAREADREALRQEFRAMMEAAPGQISIQPV